MILPQLGSDPFKEHLTNDDSETAFVTFRASLEDTAPFTSRVTNLVTPSPSLTNFLARSIITSFKPSLKLRRSSDFDFGIGL